MPVEPLHVHDRKAVRDIRSRLQTFTPGEPSALDWYVPALYRLTEPVGAGSMLTVRSPIGRELAHCSFVQPTRDPEKTRAIVDECVRQHPRWAAYDADNPPLAQRNKVLIYPAPSTVLHRKARGIPPLGFSREEYLRAMESLITPYYRAIDWDRPTARALVCDGPRLLAYVGITAKTTFRARQLAAFRATLSLLRTRLRMEAQLAQARFATAALDAVIERMPTAVFVLDRSRRVLHVNKVATVIHERDREQVLGQLFARGGPAVEDYDTVHLAGGEYTLVIARGPQPQTELRAAVACRRWELTPRQGEVLRLIAKGYTNQRIGAELGCAESTVEIHVSRILDKANVETRSAVVAALLALAV